MSAQALSSRLSQAIFEALAAYQSKRPETDSRQLQALVNEVLATVDARDLRRTPPQRLLGILEDSLATLAKRSLGQVKVSVRREGDVAVIESVMRDQPFLVSTVQATLAAEGFEVRSFLNAVIRVRREPDGSLQEIGRGPAESLIRVEVVAEENCQGIGARLESRLIAAAAMVADFETMLAVIRSEAAQYAKASQGQSGRAGTILRETEALLHWVCDEHCVILSVESFGPGCTADEPTRSLGISRVRRISHDSSAVRAAMRGEGRLARFARSTDESLVHRAGKPGHFLVTHLDDEGQPEGCLIIDVLFSYKGVHAPPEEVPVIRLALRDLLAERQLSVASDRGKKLTNAFNSLPMEFLFSQDRDVIWQLTDQILRAEVEGGSDVHIQIDEAHRSAFVVVALPRTQFSEELRQQVQSKILNQLGGTYADYGVYLDRYDNAIIHFFVTGADELRTVETDELRSEVLSMARGWPERLREAVEMVASDPSQVAELMAIYEPAFDEEHQRRGSIQRIAADIVCVESLRAGGDIDCDLYVSEFGEHPGSLNLRLFAREPLSLTEELPVIANFGFHLIDMYSRDIKLPHLSPIDMDNFRLDVRPERVGPILGRRAAIIHALTEVFSRRAGDDDLNRLIVLSSLTVREVDILRAYVAHLKQLAVPFSAKLVRQTLVDYPRVAESLVAWLSARFDPGIRGDALIHATDEALARELRSVTDYTADRVLAAFSALLQATRRTNAFVADRGKGEPFAFKVATGELTFGPTPRPYREIWVFHPDFSGVHLRGGRVARGGLRFSDRPGDFRTEIHGLMATQMVKNVLIVPMGAKGGFVLRNAPTTRDALRAAGDATYEQFIQALLSVTDNIVDGKVVRPPGIIPFSEGDDPYLVVAADKGTAHLSDTANRISVANGFWLGDAFASGGSHGYDHKKTGITARGAWEVSKRSFRELGIEPEVDTISAVGVGDMSGDVFGNGMLRSRTIRLIAAFNHMHIFVDPDPVPETSFEERKRLFDLPRSTWADYSADVLSPGGGIFDRQSKVVELSQRACQVLGLNPERQYSSDDVVQAILKAEVDLLWMGGIGTYIKAKDETHAEVGDKANDSVRVNAIDVRARVLAEGANLAITDAGRGEYARRGGHNYNAFLDNSAGVDTSDHEVNIKLLFQPLLRVGTISFEQRNVLLEDCENEVVEQVLEDNRSQSRMVSFDTLRSQYDIHRYSRALSYLVDVVPFDREAFALPAEDELQNRARKGLGLYKAEAAVMCAHAKMLAYRELLDGAPLPDEIVHDAVRDYFPARVREAAGEDALKGHLLRREIATTVLVNRLVENAGGTALTEGVLASGRSVRDVALAYLQAYAASHADAILSDLYALEGKHVQSGVYAAMLKAQGWLEDGAFYLLDPYGLPPLGNEDTQQTRALLSNVESGLPEPSKRRFMTHVEHLEELGLPGPLARRIAGLRYLTTVLDAVRLAPIIGRSAREVMWLRLCVAERFHLMYLRESFDRMHHSHEWDGPAVQALARQLNIHLQQLVQLVDGDDVDGMIERYGFSDVCARVHAESESGPTVSGLVMLEEWIRRLLASANRDSWRGSALN